MTQVSGLLLVDKPRGVTSHGVVTKIRKLLKGIKVGHTGTLDPLATGLLIVLIGKATRFSEYFLKLDKCYSVTAELGLVSDTYDVDGNLSRVNCEPIKRSDLLKVLPKFHGEIEQVPPPFSAVRIKGKRAYQLAREGKPVQLSPRRVRIHSVRLSDFNYPEFKLEVCCSSGTYIRSLIHDIGKSLNCGAVVTELRRTFIGNIPVKDAVPVKKIEDAGVEKFLKPLEEFLPLPRLEIPDNLGVRFIKGAIVKIDAENGLYKVFCCGKFIGVGRLTGGRLKPEKVYTQEITDSS